jgi:hypothetical protein
MMATKVDIICINAALKFVVVSIKTGTYGKHPHFGLTSVPLREPMDRLNDSIRVRHDLQLLIEVSMLIKFANLEICDAFTLYTEVGPNPTITTRDLSGITSELGFDSINETLDLVWSCFRNTMRKKEYEIAPFAC